GTTASATASIISPPSCLAHSTDNSREKKVCSKYGSTIYTVDKVDDADLRKMREFVATTIVAIVFLSIFGAPVLIVIMIGIFALMGSRMRQRTIRMMVEKGQPVPAELLAAEVWHVRRRSDGGRGVVCHWVCLGLMI